MKPAIAAELLARLEVATELEQWVLKRELNGRETFHPLGHLCELYRLATGRGSWVEPEAQPPRVAELNGPGVLAFAEPGFLFGQSLYAPTPDVKAWAGLSEYEQWDLMRAVQAGRSAVILLVEGWAC